MKAVASAKTYEIGARVWAVSEGDDEWYSATIQKGNDDGTYEIAWDEEDGATDFTKTLDQLRPLEGEDDAEGVAAEGAAGEGEADENNASEGGAEGDHGEGLVGEGGEEEVAEGDEEVEPEERFGEDAF